MLNDLWNFDGSKWTWISGADGVNRTGDYGFPTIPTPPNVPGAVSWIDLRYAQLTTSQIPLGLYLKTLLNSIAPR